MIKTLADLLQTESKHVNNGYCYSTFPYSCHITEALTHAKHYKAPINPTITRESNRVTITIKPVKGNRKPFIITLWY